MISYTTNFCCQTKINLRYEASLPTWIRIGSGVWILSDYPACDNRNFSKECVRNTEQTRTP